ncbi:major capsid protein [Streptomyces albidoflavus]|uniref:PCQ3_40 n=1 Tax=Streptomyces sp. W9 TaxID=682410 RepID=D0UZ89_9ACTN|nr:major capsid protein [Streptomyces sp. W9]ACX85541.1 pCQ3_40 [Streptomyces sp. W9]
MSTTLDRLLQNVTPEDINAYINGLPTPNTYALTQSVIPERKIYGPKFRIESNKRRVNAAKFRAFDTPHALARRQAERVVNEGMLPPVGQTLEMGELSLILHHARRGADDQEFIDALYDDLERHFTSIKTAMEIAAGELLATGVVNLPGVGLDVNWNVPTENKPVAATPWDQAGATPLTDEMAWIRYLKSVGAPRPARVITSERAASVLASNLEYRTAFWNSSSPETTPSATLSPPDVNAVRARWNLPPIEIYDEQVWSDDQYIRTTPESLWAMVPPNPEQWAQTQYGVTAEQDNLDSTGNPGLEASREPGMYVSYEKKSNPVQFSTTANAVAMPVLYVPNFHISATVLSED